jgi:hypothetical protein
VCLYCRPVVEGLQLLNVGQDLDPHQWEKLDPDPRQNEKYDPDPHQNEKYDLDPHHSEKRDNSVSKLGHSDESTGTVSG